MLAIRWHAEIVAEKACIISSCLVAVSYFSGSSDEDVLVQMTEVEVSTVGAILFGMEVLSDAMSAFLLDRFCDVPMLTAVPHHKPFSKTAIQDSIILGFAFTAQARCIYMASLIKFGQ